MLVFLGSALLCTGMAGAAFNGLLHGVLTPTRKSPLRPGDCEAREDAARSAKVDFMLCGLGIALLAGGIALGLMSVGP